MKRLISDLSLATVIGFALMLPFAILEFTFRPLTRQNVFELAFLFGLLWLLPMIFVAILVPIVRSVYAGNGFLARPISLLFKVALLALIVVLWASVVIDQLPCFAGIPNCD